MEVRCLATLPPAHCEPELQRAAVVSSSCLSSRVAASNVSFGAKRRKARSEPNIPDCMRVDGDDKSEDVAVENAKIVEETGIGPGETTGGEKRAGARP